MTAVKPVSRVLWPLILIVVLTANSASEPQENWDFLGGTSVFSETLTQAADCDGVADIVARNGYIESPNYPGYYPVNRNCRWVIQANPGWTVDINSEFFAVEFDENCLWDYLEIRETVNQSVKRQRFCGYDPVHYRSSSPRIELEFNSDPTYPEEGFKLKFQVLSTDSADKDKCNVTLTDSEGSITSPNFPLAYFPDTTCTYLIQGNQGDTILLDFVHFDVESTPCSYDKVTVYDAPTGGNLLSTLCGSTVSENITSYTGSLFVVFRSDANLQSTGFDARYRILPQTSSTSHSTTDSTSSEHSIPIAGDSDCFLVIDQKIGNLSSLNYPELYPRKKHCVTILDAGVPSTIDIKFEYFNIEFSPNCSYDYLVLSAENQTSDGQRVTVATTDRLCGFHPERNVFTFQGSTVRLDFTSDASVQLNGYLAYYFITPLQKELTCPLKCQNGGTCVADPLDLDFLWRCQCPPDYSGNLCEIRPRNVCDGHVCHNGGSCVVDRGQPLCHCASGFSGKSCADQDNKSASSVASMFTKIPRNATVARGSTMLLECAVNHPNTAVMWVHHGRILLEEDHSSGVQVHPGGVLLIPEVTEGQDGKYTCMAMVGGDLQERSAWISIVEPCELTVVKAPRDMTVQEGNKIIFQCFVPEATVIWRKDGEVLQLDKRKRVLVNNYLLIDSVVETDSGEYTCAARGSNGCFARKTAKLEVTPIGHGTACGRPKVSAFDGSSGYRISSGREAPEGSAPWHAIIQEKAHGTSFCGGSLISDSWILTAAHCVSEFQMTFDYPFAKESINIYVGTRNCKGQGGQFRRLKNYILHPEFNASIFDQDLALFELDRPVIFSDKVMPICLERQLFVEELLKVGRVGVITGCGNLHQGGKAPLNLNEVKIPYVSRELCQQSAELARATFTRNMICAGYSRSMRGDACAGDSGGPYAMEYHGRWVLVGLVSWGVGCDRENHYGYYTHVSRYYDWIMSTTAAGIGGPLYDPE